MNDATAAAKVSKYCHQVSWLHTSINTCVCMCMCVGCISSLEGLQCDVQATDHVQAAALDTPEHGEFLLLMITSVRLKPSFFCFSLRKNWLPTSLWSRGRPWLMLKEMLWEGYVSFSLIQKWGWGVTEQACFSFKTEKFSGWYFQVFVVAYSKLLNSYGCPTWSFSLW